MIIVALTILIFLLGLAILALSSNYLITAIIRVAKIIGIPAFIIGAVILSIASTLPELTNNIFAALKGVSNLGIGNLIGASIMDITLAIGLLHVISKPKKVKDDTSAKLLLFVLVPIGLFLFFGRDNLITRFEGAFFLVAYVTLQYFLLRKGSETAHERILSRKLILPYLMIPLAIFSLVLGAFLVVDTGETLAKLMGLSPAVIGLTFIAIGTTMPEIIQSVISSFKNEPGTAMGTVMGGTAINLTLIVGLIAVIFTLPINFSAFIMPALILAGLIVFYSAYVLIRKRTDKILGAVLIGSFVVYMIINFI